MVEGKLTQESVGKQLTTVWLGKPVFYYREVDSTNDLLQEKAATGAPAGTLLITDYQRAGKGRLRRRWLAPAGTSLLFSLLFRPGWPAARAAWLMMIGGLAVAEAIEAECGVRVGLKWPNDLMLYADGGWRKAGGLLLESGFQKERMETAVLGIGLNVNMTVEQLPEAVTPPTSLRLVVGHPLSRLALLDALLHRLEAHYDRADRGLSPHTTWNERLILLGQAVQVDGGSLTFRGVAEGVDEWGRLLVRDGDNRLHEIAAGDVTLRV